MPRKVLGARHHEMLLAPLDPRRGMPAHTRGIGAERARLHDWILRLDIEIADRREHPRQPHRPRLGPGDLAARVRRIEIVEIAERGGRRQFGEPLHLLAGPALEIGAEQERAFGNVAERAGESSNRGAPPAKENESADSGSERLLDLGTFGFERPAPPAQRRTNEARARDHAGVMWPRIRGPRAPVAAGRLPAFPRTVCAPRNANATASFASPLKKS